MSPPIARRSDQLFGGRMAPVNGIQRTLLRSPHDGHAVADVALASGEDVDRAVLAARTAFDAGDWPRASPVARQQVIADLAARYGSSLEEMALLITTENGSPITFSQLGQVGAIPMFFDGFIAASAEFPWEEPMVSPFGPQLVRREPVGVVGAITAWNVPQILIIAKLIPALLAGCTVVVKASPDAPLDALLLAEIIQDLDLPAGVVSLLVGGADAGRALVQHPAIDKIAFTGSSSVGRDIAATCGHQLKRCSLELGGKSAAIVLDDADIARTVQGLRFASFMNNGQACAAQTRILVQRAMHDEFVEALVEEVSTFVVGDPLDPATEIGPLANDRQRDRVEGYIRVGTDEGARAVAGGLDGAAPTGGCYVSPTVFVNVDNRMRIAQEEIFGPVVVVIPYDDDIDAIALANDSPFGLGGSVWAKNQDRAMSIARCVRTGMIGVNQFAPAPDMPFGGFKDSGVGREYGAEGLAEYVEIKCLHGVKSGTSAQGIRS